MKAVLCSLVLVLTASSSFAIDTVKCPQNISASIAVTRVYKTSIYSTTPGWKEAQQDLLSAGLVELELTLVQKKENACLYKDDAGNYAKFSTTQFQPISDQELEDTFEDQLSISFKVNDSTFVSFVPVKSYSRKGLVLYAAPYNLKVKTPLQGTKRQFLNDMGMIDVTVVQ